jgi:hypothetical protein
MSIYNLLSPAEGMIKIDSFFTGYIPSPATEKPSERSGTRCL